MNWLNPLGAPAARHPAPVLPVGTTSSGSRSCGLRGWPAAGALAAPGASMTGASAVLLPASCLRGWPADEAGGMLVASAAQGVHSRRGCGKIPFEFPGSSHALTSWVNSFCSNSSGFIWSSCHQSGLNHDSAAVIRSAAPSACTASSKSRSAFRQARPA
jgi:hypothetical protein